MIHKRPPDWSIEDLTASLRAVADEVRSALSSDRWVLVPTEKMMVAAHAAAGLAHCCALSEEIISAHERGAELVGRVLARSLFETWLVAYYIQLGGLSALEAVAGAYSFSLDAQARSIEEHDRQVTARRRDARRRNKKIVKANTGIRRWNAEHPDQPPKRLHELVPQAPGVVIGIESEKWLRGVGNVAASPLPLTEIIERVRKLTRDAGQEETFEAGYHLAYRGLSHLGAHTNLFVLNSYLDDRRGKANLVRVVPEAWVPSSFVEANLAMALLLTAGLSLAVLEPRGSTCDAARSAVERFNALVQPAPETRREQ